MQKGRVHDVTHCYNLGKKCFPPYVISAVSRLRHVGPAVVPQIETCGKRVCKLFNLFLVLLALKKTDVSVDSCIFAPLIKLVRSRWLDIRQIVVSFAFFFSSYIFIDQDEVCFVLPHQSWCCCIVSHSSCNIHIRFSFLLYSYRQYSLAISNLSFMPCVSLIPAFLKNSFSIHEHTKCPHIFVSSMYVVEEWQTWFSSR